jgi:transcriptional regulator with XRE-family HTH domain
MAGHKDTSAATHFGRQMKKERLAHGWSLQELSLRTAYDGAHLSRIENGLRPPTRALALACDVAFPERRGWFTDYVRREAPCCIPDSAGRNSEIYSWA